HSSFLWSADRRHLPSFPTRRSSDLPQPRMTATGDATATAIIATLLQDRVKAGKSPHLLRPVKAAVVLQVAQVAGGQQRTDAGDRSEEHTSELQSRENLVCRLLLEKK